jgi:hypothetical protein
MIMRRLRGLVIAAASLAACGQSTDREAKHATVPQPAKKKIPYCFFQGSEMKAWSAKRGKDGDIIVKGKVYRDDSRYQAILKPAVVSGTRAELSPDLQQNPTQYGAAGDWWDVSQTIPSGAGVSSVDVTCGTHTVAHFDLKPKG